MIRELDAVIIDQCKAAVLHERAKVAAAAAADDEKLWFIRLFNIFSNVDGSYEGELTHITPVPLNVKDFLVEHCEEVDLAPRRLLQKAREMADAFVLIIEFFCEMDNDVYVRATEAMIIRPTVAAAAAADAVDDDAVDDDDDVKLPTPKEDAM